MKPITIVKSKNAGDGKTTYIKKKFENKIKYLTLAG